MSFRGTYTRTIGDQTLRPTLCEIERGLFYVGYPAEVPDWVAHELPAYQLGACASEAKRQIELRARAFGFETIVWNETLLEPPLIGCADDASRGSTVVSDPSIEIASMSIGTALRLTSSHQRGRGR